VVITGSVRFIYKALPSGCAPGLWLILLASSSFETAMVLNTQKHFSYQGTTMPVYLQIVLLLVAIIIFFFLLLLIAGWGIRKYCFKIIAEMEEQRAFSAGSAANLPDTRGNFFKMGLGNYRPKALQILLADKIVVKANNGRYYLDKDKLAQVRSTIDK
jgi:hypothetical protein